MKPIKFLLIPLIAAGCSSLMLKPADYSWPVENVLKIDTNGLVSEDRHTFQINVKPIFYEEFADSNLAENNEIRVIRDQLGYYYMTAPKFKNVYVFESVEGGMELEKKISISDTLALNTPVFNQRPPYIELVDGSNKYFINNKGIVR